MRPFRPRSKLPAQARLNPGHPVMPPPATAVLRQRRRAAPRSPRLCPRGKGSVDPAVLLRRDALSHVVAGRWGCSGASSRSGQRGFALLEQHLVTDARGEHVVDFLKPGKLGLKVTYSSLQPAHLRNHAGIWPANMAKQSLRHCFEVLHTE